MTTWLIPANTKFYDVFAAFELDQTYWPMNAKHSIGDTLYIYLAAPYKQIGFVTDVTGIDYEFADIRRDVLPFIKGDAGKGPVTKPFIRLRPTATFELHVESVLSLNYLRQHGLNGMLMGARKLDNNPELFNYIKGNTT